MDGVRALSRIIGQSEEPVKVACIGWRYLPEEALAVCRTLGENLARHGIYIGTGGAGGADQAFAEGGAKVDVRKVILYLPWTGFRAQNAPRGCSVRVPPWPDHDEFVTLAEAAHPIWSSLKPSVQALHVRNMAILRNSSVVLAWPRPDGRGGTATGMRAARQSGIPLLDLRNDAVRESALRTTQYGSAISVRTVKPDIL